MAIDEVGMPIDKKDKKGKGVVTGGPRDCDDAACRAAAAAACAANPKVIVDTYGGHGAQGAKPIAISESGVHVKPQQAAVDSAALSPSSSSGSSSSCPAPDGMAINEKGTVGTPTKKPKSNK
jgi:hypothetical protein